MSLYEGFVFGEQNAEQWFNQTDNWKGLKETKNTSEQQKKSISHRWKELEAEHQKCVSDLKQFQCQVRNNAADNELELKGNVLL